MAELHPMTNYRNKVNSVTKSCLNILPEALAFHKLNFKFISHHKNILSKTGSVIQAVACLLCKYQALSTNPNPTKKRKM
jgi:hypothetical protein